MATQMPQNPAEDLTPDIVITGKFGEDKEQQEGVEGGLPQFTFDEIEAQTAPVQQELTAEEVDPTLPQFTFDEVQANSAPQVAEDAVSAGEVDDLPEFTAEEIAETQVQPSEDKDLGWWENFDYAWDSSLGLSGEISDWATRNDFLGLGDFGAIKLEFNGEDWDEATTVGEKLGAFFTTPEEAGAPEGWAEKSPEQIRLMMQEIRQRDLAQKYPEVTAQGGAKGSGAFFGTAAKLILDPTTALPVGQTAKAAGLIGGSIGGTTSYLQQQREKGEVDPLTVAASTVLAAGGSAAFVKGAQVMRIKLDQRAIDNAKIKVNKTVDKANDMLAVLASRGKHTKEDAVDIVATRMGVTPRELNMSARSVGRRINYPDQKTADLITQTRMIKDDPLAARPVINQVFQGTSNFFNAVVRPIANEIRAISPEVDALLGRYDYLVHRRAAKYEQRAEAFVDEFKALSQADQDLVALHLANQNFSDVRRILANRSPSALRAFDEIPKLLDEVLKDLQKAGINIKGLQDYFPRKVTDLGGLRTQLGTVNRNLIEEAEKRHLQYLNKGRGEKLTSLPAEEAAKIRNEILEGRRRLYTTKGFTYERVIDEVTEDMLPYYGNPVDSLVTYLHKSAVKIEQANLFGGSKVLDDGADTVNLESSIGRLMADLRSEGRITRDDEQQLTDLVTTYFGPGQQAPSTFISNLKAFSYIPTLGNFQSTLTQIKDLGMSAYAQGFVNTVRAALPLVGRRGETITAQQMGLRPVIAKEFSDSAKVAKGLNYILKRTGFNAVDGFGKKVTMNAALLKWQNAAKSTKGISRLNEKYGVAFPEDFKLLVTDLKAGKTTPRTELLAFLELTRTQPISPYRMPKGYLGHPDWRLLYTLKSFTVTQLNLVREEILKEAVRNPTQAAINLTRYAVLLNLAGIPVDTVKDMIMQRPVDQDRINEYAIANLLGFAGVNNYMWEKYLSKGDASGFLASLATPPLGQVSDVVKDVMDLTAEEDEFSLEDKPIPTRTLGNLPFLGPYIENYLGGGRQRAIQEQERKELQLED